MSGSNAPLYTAPNSGNYQPTFLNIYGAPGGNFAPSVGLFGPAYTGSADSFTFDPGFLAAALYGFQSAGASALKTVSDFGGYALTTNQNLFGGWEQDQNAFMTTIAAGFKESVDKSATACGGFLSCLFG